MNRLGSIARVLLPALMGAIALSGCATSLKAIKTSPNEYVGTEVMVAGTVGRVVRVPFIRVDFFSLSDAGSSMLVISTQAPETGRHVRMRARVVGVADKKALTESRPALEGLQRYLVDHRLASKQQARRLSRTLLKLAETVLGATQGSYFLIDESNS